MDTPAPSTVLIVEDDPIISGLLEHALHRRGFIVRTAADGQQATELLEWLEPPQAVLLDVMLPYVDGFELIRRIRNKAGWSGVPIIVLTSRTQEQSVVRALEAGASDYVLKPFRPDELVARVRRAVRQTAA
jgi:two-component system, OmpR family, alkaline phosphatase synthesis response regulator PhoP